MQDAVSNQRLALVHPALAAKVNAAANLLAMEGTHFRVAQGLRTYAEQAAIPTANTNAGPGHSWHNFGLAVDCYPFLNGTSGDLNWDASSLQFNQMVRALKNQGLAWGGDWKSIFDAPHFQLEGIPVTPTDADRETFASRGIRAVWAMYDPEENHSTVA